MMNSVYRLLDRLRDPQVAVGVLTLGVTTFLAGAGLWATEQGVDHRWAASVTIVGVPIALLGLALLLIGTPARKQPANTGVTARADRDSQAFSAGRDLHIGQYNATPTHPAGQDRTTPSFELSYQPAPDGWVHLLLRNLSDPGLFHVDVTSVSGTADPQTTPYSVKWRGSLDETRNVVKEALIDLAVLHPPREHRDGVVSTRRKKGNWESGTFRLFGFSKQTGWDVRARDPVFKLLADDIPDEFSFFCKYAQSGWIRVRSYSERSPWASIHPSGTNTDRSMCLEPVSA